MQLQKKNPTKTENWKILLTHFSKIKNVHLRDLFSRNTYREKNFHLCLGDLSVDFSKNRITEKTLRLLVDFAKEMGLEHAIELYFGGGIINEVEDRVVLHTALRSDVNEIKVNGKNIIPQIHNTLSQMQCFTNDILLGKHKGYTGKTITDVVNIGIGGSDLGPQMVVEALKFYKTRLNIHFISNIDDDHINEIIKDINFETAIFIVVSKTFTTQETLTNAQTIKKWFLQKASEKDIAKHFVAVSENIQAVKNFGIDTKNIFTIWDWVGGRFSLWSAVGLSISLAVGFENFKKLLEGAKQMDKHFQNTSFEKNIPVVLALLSIWYNNFFNCETESILPYSQSLRKLPAYLQQVAMESNGKSIDQNGDRVNYQTGTIVWGGTGTNIQHAFMQLVHQGTKLIPCDFIGYRESLYKQTGHHQKLMANLYAQTQTLCYGKIKEKVVEELKGIKNSKKLIPFKIFEGNKPSNIILQKKLSPKSLGVLIAMYEHKIFTQGILWNIFSYDQWGVELGKEFAKNIY